MTSRNLTEVFVIMRNNAIKNRNIYEDRKHGDSEMLLGRTLHDIEDGSIELRDDCGSPPIWTDKLEEAQYAISKIKPKLDELGSLHARHLLRPTTFDENNAEEHMIDELSQEISKLITSTHRHIQCIRSSLGVGNKIEQRLTKNVVTYLLITLQDLTSRYRNSQNQYLKQLNCKEERSNKFFEATSFTTIDLNVEPPPKAKNVDTFDNFLQPKATVFFEEDNNLDEHFGQPISSRMTQQQLLLFEEENTRIAAHREEEVTKIVKSIVDLNDIFKELSHMVQEQGTILDRIDYNVEQTQSRVSDGLRQLQKAEMYQRKNRKMVAIMVLTGITLFLLVLLIFTKF